MNIDQLITQVNAATNAAADRVSKLIASIKSSNGGTLTPAQESDAAAIVAHLQSIGADASNPVPSPAPAPPTPTP